MNLKRATNFYSNFVKDILNEEIEEFESCMIEQIFSDEDLLEFFLPAEQEDAANLNMTTRRLFQCLESLIMITKDTTND